ncbi:hypothetical protein [Dyadobacter koreensis]|nr:hypothetical protein [Dyadobacter koreensis]
MIEENGFSGVLSGYIIHIFRAQLKIQMLKFSTIRSSRTDFGMTGISC